MASLTASGTSSTLKYLEEATWPTMGSAASAKLVRKLPGASVTLERTQLTTQELNNRRALTSIRLGTKRARVNVPFELFYGAADTQFYSFMQSWMCAPWTSAASATSYATSMTPATVSNGTSQFTAAGTGTNSFTSASVGKWYKISGSAVSGANRFVRMVSYDSSTTFTFAVPSGYPTGTTLGAAISFTPVAYVVPGSTLKSISFEEAQTDLTTPYYKKVLGAVADTFSLTMTPDALITGNFGFFGYSFASSTSAALTGNNAAPTTNVMTSNDTLSYLTIDNVPSAVITSLTLNGANGLEEKFPIGALTPYDIGFGISQLSGTLDLYITDVSFWTKYEAGTTFGLSVCALDPDAAAPGTGYAFDIPKIKITGLTENKTQSNVIQSIPWTAVENTAAGTGGLATASLQVSLLA